MDFDFLWYLTVLCNVFFFCLTVFGHYDNQSYGLIAISVWNFPCWSPKLCVRCDMASIEPMHHNKSAWNNPSAQDIQTALDKARAQDRTQLLSKGIPTASSDNFPLASDEDTSDEVEPATVTRPSFLVLTHHPENQVFHTILNNHWDLLGASDTTRCLHDAGFKIGSRRNRRLQDILVHSSIPLPHKRGKQDKRISECPKTACIYCDSMDKTGHIYSYTTKQSYESKFNICCQSSNLVYCLQCNTCGKQYVGQTKRKFREHFNNIRKDHQNDPIGRHFNTTGQSGDIK